MPTIYSNVQRVVTVHLISEERYRHTGKGRSGTQQTAEIFNVRVSINEKDVTVMLRGTGINRDGQRGSVNREFRYDGSALENTMIVPLYLSRTIKEAIRSQKLEDVV